MRNCPGCGRIDQVQKVSAIVAAGTSVADGYGGPTIGYEWGTMPGTQTSHTVVHGKTDLARRLAPPREPELPPKPTGWVRHWLLSPLLGFVSAGLLALKLFPVGKLWFADCLCFAAAWPVMGLLINRVLRRYSIAERDYPAALARYAEEHHRWERARDVWNNAYYCHRCDRVFQG